MLSLQSDLAYCSNSLGVIMNLATYLYSSLNLFNALNVILLCRCQAAFVYCATVTVHQFFCILHYSTVRPTLFFNPLPLIFVLLTLMLKRLKDLIDIRSLPFSLSSDVIAVQRPIEFHTMKLICLWFTMCLCKTQTILIKLQFRAMDSTVGSKAKIKSVARSMEISTYFHLVWQHTQPTKTVYVGFVMYISATAAIYFKV